MNTMVLTPNKLKVLCEIDCPALGIRWAPIPPILSVDKIVASEVYRVIKERPAYLDQFPYIDC
jgi:hypothetical protein